VFGAPEYPRYRLNGFEKEFTGALPSDYFDSLTPEQQEQEYRRFLKTILEAPVFQQVPQEKSK
jgi:hypothetical protein